MAGRIDWLRVIITLTLSVLVIYLPIRQLRMNKIFKRVPRYRRGGQAGATDAPCYAKRAASFVQQVSSASRIRMPSIHERQQGTIRPAQGSSGDRYQNRRQEQRERSPSDVNYEYEMIEASSALAPIDTFLHYFYRIIICCNWWLLAKHLTVCILRLDALAHFRYLDCYLMGRFIVNGRVIELACYCACFLVTYKLAWYYSIECKYEGDFKLSCFEFLLVGHEEVARWSRRARARASVTSEDAVREEDEDDGLNSDSSDSDRIHSALFEFRNPFESNNFTKCYGLRPNRTPECWHGLTRLTLRYHKIFMVVFAILVSFFLSMVLPVTLNQKGFEYNYRYCIQYITRERIRAAQDPDYPKPNWVISYFFSLIRHNQDELGGSLGKVLFFNRANVTDNFRLSSRMSDDFLQPIKNVVRMNPYHVVRIFFDIVDSVAIYFQIAFALNCSCYMIVLLCRDVVNYCSAINARLSSLIVALRSTSNIDLGVPDDYYYDTNIKYNERLVIRKDDTGHKPKFTRRDLKLIRADIHEIQAMIADMFTMIDSYNKFISHQMVSLMLFWLGYSALVSSWIFIPGNDSPKSEWYTLHVFATIYLLFYMYQFSAVKSECRHLYNRIAIAMALDEFIGTSKITWTSLLKFYTPVPLFCFTMIKSIELNLMFGLKMLAWLFSALIVASSFFTVYHMD